VASFVFLFSALVSNSYLQSYSVTVKNVPLLRLAKKLLFMRSQPSEPLPRVCDLFWDVSMFCIWLQNSLGTGNNRFLMWKMQLRVTVALDRLHSGSLQPEV